MLIEVISQPCKKKFQKHCSGERLCTLGIGSFCINSTQLLRVLDYCADMATVLPPPSKRQRTDAADRARQQQDIEVTPSDAGTLRLQFYDETTGLPIGQGPVLVPVADATPKNLELLLNTLQGHVRRIPCFQPIQILMGLRMSLNTSRIDSRSQYQIRKAMTRSLPPSQRIYGRPSYTLV